MKIIKKNNNTICEDERLPIIKKLLSSFAIQSDLENSYAAWYPDGSLILIIRRSAIISCIVSEFVIEQPLYINCALTEFAKKVADPETPDCVLVSDINIISDIDYYKDQYINKINNNFYNLVSKEIDIGDSEEFQPYRNIKSDQGCMFLKSTYPNKSYTIPFITNFPKLTSADKLDISIYDYDAAHHIIKLDVYKKKINRVMTITYRVLKLF